MAVNTQRLSTDIRTLFDEAVRRMKLKEANMAVNPMMNAGMANQIGAGQSSIFNGIGTQQAYPSTLDPRRYYEDPMTGMKMEIINAENGYILRTANYEGQVAKVYVALTADELRDQIIAVMVANKLEK